MKSRKNLGLFAISFFIGLLAWKCIQSMAPGILWSPETPSRIFKQPNSHLSFTHRDSMDHLLYHWDVNGVASRIREPDFLLIGNSRMLLGIHSEVVEKWTQTSGLTLYNLSFDHGEGHAFVRQVIQQHKIRPRFIIAHLDDYFFSNNTTPHGKAAQKATAWEANRRNFNFNASARLQYGIHRLIPKCIILDRTPIVAFRSNIHGCVTPHLDQEKAWEIKENPLPDPTPDTQEIENAILFHELCRKQGAELYLTQVPHPDINYSRLLTFSRVSGIPAVPISLPIAQTFDGSHLTRDSARQFTRLLLESIQSLVTAPVPLTPAKSL